MLRFRIVRNSDSLKKMLQTSQQVLQDTTTCMYYVDVFEYGNIDSCAVIPMLSPSKIAVVAVAVFDLFQVFLHCRPTLLRDCLSMG